MTAANATVKRLLVVDDDAVFRARLVKAIALRGYETYGAASLNEALALARQVDPKRGVIDLRIGAESGLDLVRRLMEMDSTMQLVILTGYGSIATAVEAVRLGAANYLSKPADTDQILAAFAGSPPPPVGADQLATPSLARVEWEHIQRILLDCSGNISEASRRLRIHRRSLQRKLSKYAPLQ
jgi:two-component system, response regulator RegA